MRAKTLDCSPERLRQLLDQDLSEHEEAEVESHLDRCESCQRTIEEISGGTRLWSDARRIKDLRSSTCSRRGIDTEWNESDGPAELPWLDFLTPGDRPEILGLLGSYEVLRVIGRGGMGLVLQAFDPALNRMVAIKVLAPELATSANARRRFAREAQATAAIAHDHIVAIFAVEARSRLPYLVMQYVPGQSLQDRIDKDGPLTNKAILRIALQAASGLAAAHAQGLVHRDIKPSNILLENGVERVKITDFGLARAIDDASLTQSGIVAGTPQYMSPEQTRGAAIDYRADLFSLGSVIYAMCTGHSPFRAETTMGVLRRVSDDAPRPIREINPDIPDWLEAIVAKLHAKDPADRFQSAGEVAELFGRCLAYAEQPRGKTPPFTPITRKRSGKTERRLRIAAALSVVLLAGLGAGEASGVAKVTDLVATVFRVRTAEGTLIVEVADPDVKVTVDGEEIVITGAGPQEIHLRPGKHELKSSKPGVPERIQMVEIVSGRSRPIKVDFEPKITTDAQPKAVAENTNQAALRERLALIAHELAAIERLMGRSNDDRDILQLRSYMRALEVKMAEFDLPKLDVDFREGPSKDRVTEKRPPDLLLEKQVENAVAKREWARKVTQKRPPDPLLEKQVENAVAKVEWARKMNAKGYLSRQALEREQDRIRSLQDRLGKLWEKAGGDSSKPPAQTAIQGPVLPAIPSPGITEPVGPGRVYGVVGTPATKPSLRIPVPDDPAPRQPEPDSTPQPEAIVTQARNSGPQPKATLRALPGRRILALAFSPDGKTLATVAGVPAMDFRNFRKNRGELALWKPQSGHVHLVNNARALRALAFSPDGTTLATAGFNANIDLRDPGNGTVRHKIEVNELGVNGLSFAPDGKTLVSAGLDGTVRLWDLASGQQGSPRLERAFFRPNGESVYTAVFVPDGTAILTGGVDQVATLWDLTAGARTRVLRGHSGPVEFVAVSPDGKLVVTTSWDGLAKLWDLSTGIERTTLAGHTRAVLGAAFSPDGKLLATCSGTWDAVYLGPGTGEIKIWDVATMTELVTLRDQHSDRVFSVAFSPDGTTLASGSWDSTVRLWDVNSLIQPAATDRGASVTPNPSFGPEARPEPKGAETPLLLRPESR